MKYKILTLIMSISLAACSVLSNDSPSSTKPELENVGPAPELTNTTWLNTDQPLRLVDLRGQVVLLEMWTFG